MNIDIGLPPIATLLIATLVLAILSDFLLELFSVRMSQSTGRLQGWLFDQFGHNLFGDFLISIIFQLFSFRKKAYFLQVSSLINVGSFNKKQVFILLSGSFVGMGASIILLMGGHLVVGGSLCLVSFLLSLFSKDQLKDVGMAFLALGLFLTSLFFFNQYLLSSTLNIHNYQLSEVFVFAILAGSTLFFKTPVAFIITIALLHFFIGLNVLWLPALFLGHWLLSLSGFYWQFFKKRKRLNFSLASVLFIQVLQFSISMGLVCYLQEYFASLFVANSYYQAYKVSLVAYALYTGCSVLLAAPGLFLISLLPFFKEDAGKKTENQKIINLDQRGQCFSIHLSLFLLRQEFKKYTTSVHTIFKISRETDYEEEKINQKFVRYQGMLVRVGDELKELCFNIGKQRSYRWQVKEIMSYYRIVNQLELLVDDLGLVAAMLREKDQDEEWEKECRFWLGLQLKLFESFFQFTVGVGKDDPEKVKANIEKSYEILDRFFVDKKASGKNKVTSQTFYRITESIGNLAL